jgi:hypothetical protein
MTSSHTILSTICLTPEKAMISRLLLLRPPPLLLQEQIALRISGLAESRYLVLVMNAAERR